MTVDATTLNLTLHLAWLVESLLLKKALPYKAYDPLKLHLAVEDLRPRGYETALGIAKMVEQRRPKSEIKEEIYKTLVSVLERNRLPEDIVDDDDAEKIYFWLEVIEKSDAHVRWGSGKEFL